jgi:hypothetical protein
MYVEQLESTPSDDASLQPIVAPTLDEGPHLSYTIQWFIFSICVIVGWVLAGAPLDRPALGQGRQEAEVELHPDRRRDPRVDSAESTCSPAAPSGGTARRRWGRVVRVEVAVDRVDVDGDAAELAERTESGRALISAAISRVASHASTPPPAVRPPRSSTNDR